MATTAYTSSYTGAQIDAAVGAVANKADSATTLAGYGITDAYTKTENYSYFYAIWGGTVINASSTNAVDLDTYTTSGNFSCTTGNSQYVSNRPVADNKAFRLVVMATSNSDSAYLRQRFQIYNSKDVYERCSTGTVGSWGSWAKVQADLGDIAAATLSTARSLWGQSFNGSADVSGNMTGVGSIDASGNITTSGYVAVGVGGANGDSCVKSDTATNIYLKNSSGAVLVCDGKVVRRSTSSSMTDVTLGSSTYPWGGLYSTTGDFSSTLSVTGATTLSSTLGVTGNTTLSGHMYFANNKAIHWKDSGGTNREILGVSSSNNLNIGYSAPAAGSNTYIHGSSISLRIGGAGSSSYNALSINSSKKATFSGDVDITGSLSFNGTAVATVYSGSSAPSSGTGSNGDIYIQTS